MFLLISCPPVHVLADCKDLWAGRYFLAVTLRRRVVRAGWWWGRVAGAAGPHHAIDGMQFIALGRRALLALAC